MHKAAGNGGLIDGGLRYRNIRKVQTGFKAFP